MTEQGSRQPLSHEAIVGQMRNHHDQKVSVFYQTPDDPSIRAVTSAVMLVQGTKTLTDLRTAVEARITSVEPTEPAQALIDKLDKVLNPPKGDLPQLGFRRSQSAILLAQLGSVDSGEDMDMIRHVTEATMARLQPKIKPPDRTGSKSILERVQDALGATGIEAAKARSAATSHPGDQLTGSRFSSIDAIDAVLAEAEQPITDEVVLFPSFSDGYATSPSELAEGNETREHNPDDEAYQ